MKQKVKWNEWERDCNFFTPLFDKYSDLKLIIKDKVKKGKIRNIKFKENIYDFMNDIDIRYEIYSQILADYYGFSKVQK